MKRRCLPVFALLASFAASTFVAMNAGADESAPARDPATIFRQANEALGQERAGDAIALLESLGDHGVVDAAVSFDRGLAYASRVRAGAEQPGDLGRAAHGFDEARALTHDPALAADATRAVSMVRAEVARRRARNGDSAPLDSGMSLGRSIVELLPENAWAALAGALALILTIGIAVRSVVTTPRRKVAANTTSAIAASALVLVAMLAWSARDARLHLREGVVVAQAARLLDERHVALGAVAPVAEGARVRLLDEASGFSHVVIGSAEGWLPSSAVLPIAKAR